MFVVRFREGPHYRGFILEKMFENFVGILETVRIREVSVWRGSTVNKSSFSDKRNLVHLKPIIVRFIVLRRFFLQEYCLFKALFFIAIFGLCLNYTHTLFSSHSAAARPRISFYAKLNLYNG